MKLNLKFTKQRLPVLYDNLTHFQRRSVREEYVKRQNHLCHYCKQPLARKPLKRVLAKKLHMGAFPPNFFKYPIHLHHDHNTGLTIGAVHAYCNAVLWQYHGE